MDGALHRQLRAYRREAVAELLRQRAVNNDAPIGMPPPNHDPGRVLLYRHPPMHPQKAQSERILVESDNILSYGSDEKNLPGVYIGAKCLNVKQESGDYFEIEVLDSGLCGDIAMGLVPWNHPLDQLPGFIAGSVGYHAGDGKVYLGHQRGNVVSSKCEVGDRIGCGIRLVKPDRSSPPFKVNKANLLPYISTMKLRVFFTLNGNEVSGLCLLLLLLLMLLRCCGCRCLIGDGNLS